jgi:hypothetical protein
MSGNSQLPDTVVVRDLSRTQCLTALGGQSFGRVAVTQGALPLVLPVNYAMNGPDVVFRARKGGLLDRACRDTVVAFETDQCDGTSGAGWSVVVVGIANVIAAGDWLEGLDLGLPSAAAGTDAMFITIVPGNITGRTIEFASSFESITADPTLGHHTADRVASREPA